MSTSGAASPPAFAEEFQFPTSRNVHEVSVNSVLCGDLAPEDGDGIRPGHSAIVLSDTGGGDSDSDLNVELHRLRSTFPQSVMERLEQYESTIQYQDDALDPPRFSPSRSSAQSSLSHLTNSADWSARMFTL